MRTLILCLLAASITCAIAQQGDEKERLIFQPGAKEPNAEPAPAPTPRRLDKPGEAIDMFFLALKGNQVDAAYDALVKDSIIADRKEDVAALKARTKQAIDSYGPVSGYELVDERIVGTSLLRRTLISLNSDLPLRWRFYFYRSQGVWRLVDLRVDDGLVELFEETGKPRK